MGPVHISKRYRFESAHFLPAVPSGHPCGQMHGHSYELEVTLAGLVDKECGWVKDFSDVTSVVRPLIQELDHRLLNDVSGLQNPTCEVLAIWAANRLATELPGLVSVRISETPSSSCVYYLD